MRRDSAPTCSTLPAADARSERGHPSCSRPLRSLLVLILALSFFGTGCALFGSASEATGDPIVDVNANDPAVVQAALQLIRSRNEIRAVGSLIDNLDRDDTQVRHNSFTTLVKLLTDNRFITYPKEVDPRTLTAQQRADYVAFILYNRFGYSWGNPIDPARTAAVTRWREWYEEEGKAEIEAFVASGKPPAEPSLMDLKRVPLPSDDVESEGTPTPSADGTSQPTGG